MQGDANVEGVFARLDCLGRQARLVIQTADGKTVQLLVRDPGQIVLVQGGGEKALALRCTKDPAQSVGSIQGQAGRQTPHRRRSHHHRIPLRRALKQFIFRMLGKDPEAIVVSFATRRPGTCAPHVRRDPAVGAAAPPRAGNAGRPEARRDVRNLPAAPPAVSRLSDRPGAGIAYARPAISRAAARGVPAGADQDSGLQPAPGAAPSATLRSRPAVSQRRPAGPDFSASEVAGAVEERPIGLSLAAFRKSRDGRWPRAGAGSRC